jgi:hypothetical protein
MASKNFDIPDNIAVVDPNGNATVPWTQWIARVHRIVTAVQSSGLTAERPTSLLWVGRTFFDTSIGYPIWVQSINPVVWVDAFGNPA